jgi:hemoglobin-like flavoprotein
MTNQQIELIRQSWALVQPMSKQAGMLFYKKLFTMAPGVRHLFKDDISEQAGKLMVILGYVVAKLNKMDELVEDVRKLGARHNAYGAHPAHYEAVGQCLIATLREGLGPAWNAEIQNAWTVAYNTLKNVMIIAQEEQKEAIANHKI